MKCIDIIKDHLEENNYAGLFNREGECGCAVDDLQPCSDGLCAELCEPGYLQVEERDCGFLIGEYHPKLCPNCKTKRDFGPRGFRFPCQNCGHEN